MFGTDKSREKNKSLNSSNNIRHITGKYQKEVNRTNQYEGENNMNRNQLRNEQLNNGQYEKSRYENSRYNNEQYENPQYGNSQYGNSQYGNSQYGNPQYGNPQLGNSQYGNPQYENLQYENLQYEGSQHGNPRYENSRYNNQQYQGSMYDEASRRNDDDYLVGEISRIKQETNDLRKLLNERKAQVDKIQDTVDRCGVDSNALVAKIAKELDKLADRIEDMEEAITDSVERNNKNITEGVAAATKPIEERCKKLTDEIDEKIEGIRKDINISAEKSIETKNTVDAMDEKLENKAEKKAVLGLHNRLSTMFAIGVADLVGTVMTLIILCYLILSISR